MTVLSWTIRILAALVLVLAGTTGGSSFCRDTTLTADGNAPGPYNPNEPVSPQPARGG